MAAVNLMDSALAWEEILDNFGLSQRAIARFTEDFTMPSEIMASNPQQIKSVVNSQNKTYRSHATAGQRCYINTAQLNRVLAFYKWTIVAIKDGRAEYEEADAATFDLDWVNSIVDEYLMKDPSTTPQSTPPSVIVPKFVGTNWHDTKSKLTALLATRIGNSGIPLTYLVRKTRLRWEDTDTMNNLQERRISTKAHEGNTYELDNRELFRILMSTFTATTLDNVVKSFQATNDGMSAWTAITANVEGSNYFNELKRQGDAAIEGVFFDPNKNFAFEKYFDKHVRSHELHAEAEAPVPEWRKIDLFMKGVRCTALQNDFRGLKDDPLYKTFTAMYNKINENYRTLIDQGILKPVSVFKRRIAQLGSDPNSNPRGGRAYRGRGRDFGRGRGYGRYGRGRGFGRGRGYGRGRGRGGRQQSGRGRNIDMSQVNMSALPPNIDLNNLSFSDDEWYAFSQAARDAISALRLISYGGQGRGRGRHGPRTQPERQIFQLVQLPPTPTSAAPIPPNDIPAGNIQHHGGNDIRSTDAGSAFGRNGPPSSG